MLLDIPISDLANLENRIEDDTDKSDDKSMLLVVEDNDDLRYYMRSFLIEDYRILEAKDGEMGFEKAIEKVPDLVISDVMMPKMNGIELTKKLKTDERTSHIPVVLLTAKAAKEDKLEGLETGADDFLSKPFDQDELLVRISNLIQQRKRLREKIIRNIETIDNLSDVGVTSMDQKFLSKSKEVVEKHLSNSNFSVDQFIKEMAMSRAQLHRKLKALLDQSATEYIRIIRLNRAAILLKQKSGNIAEIAYDVGFNNPSYFSECFKKQFGVLPSDFQA
jgi:YesN/AraC family two-component response regulator